MQSVSPQLRWLTSEAARRWLEDPPLAALGSLALARRLRRQLSAEQARLVAQQFELRRRGRAKFEFSGRMLFTPPGLEQATDETLACYKAGRFPRGAVAADLCCGIGGDLLALAARGPVLGIELDPVTAWLAAANLRAAEAVCGGVGVADATDLKVQAAAAWHIDPDRRPEGRRTSQPERSRPSLAEIEALLAVNQDAAVKLAPAAQPPPGWGERAELEWLGRRGECRQLVAWFGGLAQAPGRRRATLVGEDGRTLRTVDEPAGPIAEPAIVPVGRYLFEPHPAVLAAGLSAALAAEHGLARVAAGIAYFTGECFVADPAFAAFETIEELPCDRRQLKAACRRRGIGQLEVKKRRVDLDPARLRAELSGPGGEEAVLLLYRCGRGARAVLARRC